MLKIILSICIATVMTSYKPITEQLENNELIHAELLNRSVEFVYQSDSNTVEEIETDLRFEALVHATWRLETGNGTSYLWTAHNNAGGIRYTQEYAHFESQEEGMQVLRELLEWYVDQFGYDFVSIRDMYCDCGGNDYEIFMQIYNEEMEKLSDNNNKLRSDEEC